MMITWQVDELVHEVDRHVPAVVKGASCQAFSAARSVSSEVQRAGVIDTAAELAKVAYTRVQPTVKELYIRYEPVAEGYAVSAWRSLNRLPLFPEVAHIVVPTAAYWSEKYNRSVLHIADKGYTVSAYMPLVPTERIAKVFGGEEGGSKLDSGRVEPPPSAGADVAVAAEWGPPKVLVCSWAGGTTVNLLPHLHTLPTGALVYASSLLSVFVYHAFWFLIVTQLLKFLVSPLSFFIPIV